MGGSLFVQFANLLQASLTCGSRPRLYAFAGLAGSWSKPHLK